MRNKREKALRKQKVLGKRQCIGDKGAHANHPGGGARMNVTPYGSGSSGGNSSGGSTSGTNKRQVGKNKDCQSTSDQGNQPKRHKPICSLGGGGNQNPPTSMNDVEAGQSSTQQGQPRAWGVEGSMRGKDVRFARGEES